jgi:sulfur-oxidizing protein SoxY
MQDRRDFMGHSLKLAVLLGGAGLLPTAAQAAWNEKAFEAKTVADLAKALGAPAPAESKDVSLTAPEIAENGAVVRMGVASSLPGVRRMMLLVEKNPNVLAAMFDVSDSVDANFSTNVKMGQSSNVYAVAQLADGRMAFTVKEVKVTLGGCGG